MGEVSSFSGHRCGGLRLGSDDGLVQRRVCRRARYYKIADTGHGPAVRTARSR
jgi:hypothetical protein